MIHGVLIVLGLTVLAVGLAALAADVIVRIHDHKILKRHHRDCPYCGVRYLGSNAVIARAMDSHTRRHLTEDQ